MHSLVCTTSLMWVLMFFEIGQSLYHCKYSYKPLFYIRIAQGFEALVLAVISGIMLCFPTFWNIRTMATTLFALEGFIRSSYAYEYAEKFPLSKASVPLSQFMWIALISMANSSSTPKQIMTVGMMLYMLGLLYIYTTHQYYFFHEPPSKDVKHSAEKWITIGRTFLNIIVLYGETVELQLIMFLVSALFRHSVVKQVYSSAFVTTTLSPPIKAPSKVAGRTTEAKLALDEVSIILSAFALLSFKFGTSVWAAAMAE